MRIAVVGSYGTGMTMRADRIPDRGETLGDAAFSLGPGGKGSNQAIGAARLGAEVSLLTAVGDDVLGAQGRELWRREGVDAGAVATVDAPTMTGVILVEQDGENRIIVAPGALDLLTPAHVAGFAEVIAAADLLMVCNEIPADTVAAALRTAAERGTPTLFNPAPARDLPQDVAALVDVLTPNLTEAQVLTGLDTTDPDVLLDALRQRFTAKIVLTCGTDGAHVDDGVERAHIAPVPATQVVDTTGAGDAFNAAFAVAWCRGWDLRRAARYAAAAGAFAVAHHEVVPGLPHPEDLEER
ncbi:ribokinase [Saccharopolyspora sp. WRP15-2]|uniref:Ribokinase n=1 Tax=Saccharopolyspora oryzae TaxID=2997343 RepID=A0ABT4UWA1_9PSEU|nr:ribokinase [Saccharopolyspora oryzae]MDA3625986.1 ribokinase [Saccharopolyspora oryzae]